MSNQLDLKMFDEKVRDVRSDSFYQTVSFAPNEGHNISIVPSLEGQTRIQSTGNSQASLPAPVGGLGPADLPVLQDHKNVMGRVLKLQRKLSELLVPFSGFEALMVRAQNLVWRYHPFKVVVMLLFLRMAISAVGFGGVAFDVTGVLVCMSAYYMLYVTRNVAGVVGSIGRSEYWANPVDRVVDEARHMAMNLRQDVVEVRDEAVEAIAAAQELLHEARQRGAVIANHLEGAVRHAHQGAFVWRIFMTVLASYVGIELLIRFIWWAASGIVASCRRSRKKELKASTEQTPSFSFLQYMARAFRGCGTLLARALGLPLASVEKEVKTMSDRCIDLICLGGLFSDAVDGSFIAEAKSAMDQAYRGRDQAGDEPLPVPGSVAVQPVEDEKIEDPLLKARREAQNALYARFVAPTVYIGDVKHNDGVESKVEEKEAYGGLTLSKAARAILDNLPPGGVEEYKDVNGDVQKRRMHFVDPRHFGRLYNYMKVKSDFCKYFTEDRVKAVNTAGHLLAEARKVGDGDMFVFSCGEVIGAQHVTIRRDIPRTAIEAWVDDMTKWSPPPIVSGQVVTDSVVDDYPTFYCPDETYVKKAFTYVDDKYRAFSEALGRQWQFLTRQAGPNKYKIIFVVFGLALLYLCYSIWNRTKEGRLAKRVLTDAKPSVPSVLPEEQSEQRDGASKGGTAKEYFDQERAMLKRTKASKSGGLRRKMAKGGFGKRAHKGGSAQSLAGPPLPAYQVHGLLNRTKKMLSDKGINVCVCCLNNWTCELDPERHTWCCNPTEEQLTGYASFYEPYKVYLERPHRQCICGFCTAAEEADARLDAYNRDKIRLGLSLQQSGGWSVLHTQDVDDEYIIDEYHGENVREEAKIDKSLIEIVKPLESLKRAPKEQSTVSFNQISISSNVLRSMFYVKSWYCPSSPLSDQLWAEKQFTSAHGFRSGLGYQLPRHMFGEYTKILIKNLQIVYFDGVNVNQVNLVDEDLLLGLSNHYNSCASGASPSFFGLDVWCIPSNVWDKALLKSFPLLKKGDAFAPYQLTTVSLLTNQTFDNAIGIIARFRYTTSATWELDFTPYVFDVIERDTFRTEGEYRLGLYWAHTVPGDSGCPIMAAGVCICQHLRSLNDDGRVAGRLMDVHAQQSIRVQTVPQLLNSS